MCPRVGLLSPSPGIMLDSVGTGKKVERGHHPRQAGKVESAGVLVSKGFELESQLWHLPARVLGCVRSRGNPVSSAVKLSYYSLTLHFWGELHDAVNTREKVLALVMDF